MSNIILDQKSAAALIRYEGRETGVYSTYVAANNVTLETVPEHVAALVALKFGDVKADGRADKESKEYKAHVLRSSIRNKMTRILGKESAEKSDEKALITAAGRKATLAEVTAAWKAAQK